MEQDDLLVLCLRNAGTSESAWRCPLLSPAEWKKLIDRAKRHRVLPLLYSRIRSAMDVTRIPPETRARLHEAYLRCAARNVRVYDELRQVLRLLDPAGIPVIALKGAHLAELVYGDIGLRPMIDLDLLLPEHDIGRARQMLVEAGYTGSGHDDHHVCLRRPDGQHPVELHWSLCSPSFPFRLASGPIWDRSEPARLAGEKVRILAPEDLLLHLCLHASYHHLFDTPLRYLCDIAAVVRHHRTGIDWPRLCALAKQSGLDRCAYLTLWSTARTLDCAIPVEVLRELRPRDLAPSWEAWALTRVLDPKDHTAASFTSVNLSRLGGAGQRRERLRILARAIFPPRLTLARIYSVPEDSLRVLLYYPVRWRDHVARHGRTLWRLLSREPHTLERARRENELRDWLGGPPSGGVGR